ncbi:MAG: undecaprenyldiphospho-muramoylpentapeptide beta-N-acetylglucosaminyltransferase [Rhodospirillales bacterium]|nr:undecaprenyldiphospho-muramoylpentapeptide beta-N-acetylglucosaminyltransferase [Rhodospirillales bacterium]
MTGPLIVLATGGTAGHVFPAEALAAELAARGCRLALFTDRRGGAFGGRLNEIDTYRIRAGGIAGKGPVDRLMSTAEIGLGTMQAWQLLKQLRPAAAIGFGGYASVPTMTAATFAGMRTAIHEQNAVLGRANRLLAGRVNHIATAFKEVRSVPAGAEAKVVRTGMPVRPMIGAVRDRVYPPLDGDSPLNILVFGGSQGAHALSQVVPQALGMLDPRFKDRLRVVQQCREEDIAVVRGQYGSFGIDADLRPFFDDIPERYAAAHLVICRSGASTVAELTAIGRPAIMVPYPHAVDDHQAFNAHALDDAGGGWLMPETSFAADALATRLDSLFSLPKLLEKAAAAAKAAGVPDAVATLADMVMGMVPGNGDAEPRRAAA